MFHVGVVENRYDPLKIGRCQVRVVGLHTDDRNELPIKDLPWAYPVQPITSAGMSGVGHAPVGPVEGTWVIIVYRDTDQQMPLMLGSIGGIPLSNTQQEPTNLAETSNRPISSTPQSGTGSTSSASAAPPDPISDTDSVIGPLAKLIAAAESGAAGYNAFNRGAGASGSPGKTKMNLVDMTIKEIMDYQALPQGDPNRLFAVGRYQMIPVTLKAACQNLNIETGMKFTERIQDMMFQEFLVCRKRPPVAKYYRGEKSDEAQLKSACSALAAEFASIEDANYPGFPYGGEDGRYYKSGNRVHIKLVDLQKALRDEWDFRNSGKGKASPLNTTGTTKTETQKADTTSGQAKSFLEIFVQAVTEAVTGKPAVGSTTADGTKSDGTDKPGPVGEGKGFADPNGKYPLYTDEPDTNRLAVNNNIGQTIIYNKESNRVQTVPVANGGTWDQTPISYNAQYPFNHVYQSECGHTMEFDDTQNSERVHLYHKVGSYIEWDANGSLVNRIIGDGYEIVDRNGYVYVKGALNVSVDGALNVRTDNVLNVEVSGTANVNIFQDANVNIVGDLNLGVGGKFNLKAAGFYFESTEDINIKSKGGTYVQSAGEMHVKSDDSMFIGAQSDLNVSAQEGGINIQAMENINVKSTSGKANIHAKGDVNVKSDANLLTSGSSNVDIRAGGIVAIDGKRINIGGGGAKFAAAAGGSVTPTNATPTSVEKPDENERRETSGSASLPQLTVLPRGAETGFDSPNAGDPTAYAQTSVRENKVSKADVESPKIELDKNTPTKTPAAAVPASCDIIFSMDASKFTSAMKLSKHFTLGEVTAGGSRIPRQSYVIDGETYSPAQIVCNLKGLCENILDPLVDKYGKNSFVITSAFRRPPDGNTPGDLGTDSSGKPMKEGGDHPRGCACDISFKEGKAKTFEVAKELPNLVSSWNQIIMEYNGSSFWVHVSYRYKGNKGDMFTMNHHKTYASTYPRGGFVLV